MGGQSPRVLVAQIGARRHYAVPILLERAGMLSYLVTDITSDGFIGYIARWAGHVTGSHDARRLADRKPPDIPAAKVVSLRLFGLWRIFRRATQRGAGALRRHHAEQNERFCKSVPRRLIRESDAVYVFNGAGLEIARYAKELGRKVILDQTSAPIRTEEKILAEERERWPGWENTAGDPNGWEVLASREEEEWKLADVIVCPSEYVRDCIVEAGVEPEKCYVVTTAAWGARNFSRPRRTVRRGRLHILFAGTLCLRKGIPYLVEASGDLKRMRPDVDIRAVGTNGLTEYGLQIVRAHMDYGGPIPRSQMPMEYENADILILPTLSEGSANVCHEALAAGVPVITTRNAGSPVQHGVNGLIVPIRSTTAVVNAVINLLSDRDRLEAMKQAASTSVNPTSPDNSEEGGRIASVVKSLLDANHRRL